jgi:hypothetical protein
VRSAAELDALELGNVPLWCGDSVMASAARDKGFTDVSVVDGSESNLRALAGRKHT